MKKKADTDTVSTVPVYDLLNFIECEEKNQTNITQKLFLTISAWKSHFFDSSSTHHHYHLKTTTTISKKPMVILIFPAIAQSLSPLLNC